MDVENNKPHIDDADTSEFEDEKLADLQICKKLLDLGGIYPENWSFDSYYQGYLLKTVSGSEFVKVSDQFQNTLPKAKIIRIERNENPWLYTQFCIQRIHKKEVHGDVESVSLFHGTKQFNVESICKNNFDWRMVGQSGYLGCKYGSGVAFSPKSSYASDYPRRCYESPRVMFIAKVLKVATCDGHKGMTIPPDNCDTSRRPNGDVVVKYCDNEFYPEYIVYYDKN